MIIRLFSPEENSEYTEVNIRTKPDLSEPPNYLAKGDLIENLSIRNTFNLYLPKFDEGVVPTRSELYEMIQMAEELINEHGTHTVYWSDEYFDGETNS